MGAFDGETLIGLAVAIPGIRNGRVYLHSHQAVVRSGYRDRGIRLELKLAQRDDAIARGITSIEWTFDPLNINDAHLSVDRLGAIVRRYSPDFYGLPSSRVDDDLPSDRMTAEWWVNSHRVQEVLTTGKLPECIPVEVVKVPVKVSNWSASAETRYKARTVQQENGTQLTRAFARGLAALRYSVDDAGGTFYLGYWNDVSSESALVTTS